MQSSKGLRVTTQCRDVDQFVRAFHRYCESSSVFISHARRSVGEVIAFSFDLADGSPALSGLGAVIEQFATADNRFGRAGILVALHRLTRTSKRVFADLSAARVAAPEPERRDETPAIARGVTSTIQMIDAEGLTPIPQPPPRPVDAPRTTAPDVRSVPLTVPRTATRPIAMIATSQQARRTPGRMKIPAISMPASPAIANGTAAAPIVSVEPVAPVAPVELVAPVEVEAQPEPLPEPAGAVIEQPDPMAEQTARMASPPYVDLVPRTPDAPIIASADAFETGHSEVAPLPPAPIDVPDLPAPAPAAPAPSEPIEQASAPAVVATATEQPAPLPVIVRVPPVFAPAPPVIAPVPPVFAPAPLVIAPVPRVPVAPVFVPQPALPSTRWSKRRIWAVATFAGSSLLALGIVIGATVVGGRTRGTMPSPQAASVPSPPPPAPIPPATPAPVPTTPAVAPQPAATVAVPTPSPVVHVAAATVPAHAIAKPHVRPKTSMKKPPHVKKHKHSAAGCTSLTCL